MAGFTTDKSIYCHRCLQRLFQHRPTRSFTTSPARRKHGGVPTFQPTSSPELDALLSTFRANVFLPAHLLALQKSLVYKSKNHRLLTNPEEPATVKLGNEVHQLHPLNHITDEPGVRKSLRLILGWMSEGRDWVNLIPFLEGLRQSGRKVRAWQAEKIVRRIGEAGKPGVVMEMLRRVEATGVKLGDVGVCREVFWGGILKCVQSGWSEEGVKDAERLMERWWDMLSDEKHVDQDTKKRSGDPKMQPEIVGSLLWVRATRSVLFGEKKDEEGKVKRAAEMVTAVWKNVDLKMNEQDWNDANWKLMMGAPVWHGMKMAQGVLGDNTSLGRSLARTVTLELEPALNKAREIVAHHVSDGGKRRGLELYDELAKVAG
ncbi:MAG: hypothetical protein Q9219_006978 [cf. Caloplaca sp. 3 TL-2023]